MSELDDLNRIFSLPEKSGLDCLLIGGHAVNAYGYERTTLDVDFMVRTRDLAAWSAALAELGYRCIHQTKAFAQFAPDEADGFRVDLMLAADETFGKLTAGSRLVRYGGKELRTAGLLHLIALKLHATRTWDRAVQGKDYYDILALIRINGIETSSPEFLAILERYATPTIKERLLRDLEGSPGA